MAFTAVSSFTPTPGGALIHVDTGDEEVAGAGGDLIAILNDSGVTRLITEARLYVHDASAAAATMDVGVASTVATNDTVLDGANLNATGLTDKVTGTSNATPEATVWAPGYYLTGTKATGAASAENSLVFDLVLKWVELSA